MRRAGVTGGVVLALSAAGVAHAYWTGAGGGAGSAGAATTSAVVLSPGAPTASLHPGGRADVVLTMTNPDAAAVTVATLALDTALGSGGFAVDEAHAGCAPSTFSFDATAARTGWTVPARTGGADGSLAVTLPRALSMGLDAADACQGARVTVYLKAGS